MKKRLSIRGAVFLTILPGALFARGDGTFGVPLRLPSPAPAFWAAVADFDGDGALDVAGVHATSEVSIAFQDRRDRNLWSLRAPIRAGNGCYFVLAADMDGDGRADLVIADPGSQAFVLRARGDGGFGAPAYLPRTYNSRILGVGDFDRDGLMDVASTEEYQRVSIVRGLGSLRFQYVTSYSTVNVHDLLVLDFDGDGILDFVAKTKETGVFPFRGRGDGRFQPLPLQDNVTIRGPIATGDFDGDGRSDIMGNFGARISNGDGTFRVTLYFEGHDFAPVGVGDLNGDGFLDALITDTSRRTLEIYRGRGDGAFEPPVEFALDQEVNSFIVDDVDRDGRNDLIVAGSDGISIVWGRSGEPFLSALGSIRGIPSSARGLAVGDFDRDGAADVLVSGAESSRVFVFAGPFRPWPSRSFAVETRFQFAKLEVLDFDGDGALDFLGTDGTSRVHVVLFDQAGSVRAATSKPAGLLPSAVAAGRIDGDSRMDAIVACTASSELVVFAGRGGAELAEIQRLPSVVGPRALDLADLDGDGAQDALVGGKSLAVHFGSGDGAFGGPVEVPAGAEGFFAVRAIDLDGDARTDLVATSAFAIWLFRNAGGRTFEPRGTVLSEGPLRSMSAEDLDGDGLPELIATLWGGVRVVRNRGDWEFVKPVNYSVALEPVAHRVADLDRDGALDALVLGPGAAAILWGNRAPGAGEFRRGDADGDGVVNLTDAVSTLLWLFSSGAAPPCLDAADSNHDGAVNVSDPVATLGYLFLGRPEPPPPGPDACGPGPEPTLGCESYSCTPERVSAD